MSSQVQSVSFPRATFNMRQALKWLKEHSFKPSKRVDKTATRWRYRLVDPAQFTRFATKELSGDIQFTIGFHDPEPEEQKDPFPSASQSPAPGPPKGGAVPKPPKRSAARGGARGNSWLDHVKAYRAAHVGISYKEALRGASATWKKA